MTGYVIVGLDQGMTGYVIVAVPEALEGCPTIYADSYHSAYKHYACE